MRGELAHQLFALAEGDGVNPGNAVTSVHS